ncbi:MAG: 50S ribosomal protein L33 [Gemmatimonadaceae bacterium]|nr:50S ribosomal protein L33 [Gemmatimonadaceae bacterium]
MPRHRITLECEVCSRRNYSATKNRRAHPDRVEYRKYCAHCGRQTLHRETR